MAAQSEKNKSNKNDDDSGKTESSQPDVKEEKSDDDRFDLVEAKIAELHNFSEPSPALAQRVSEAHIEELGSDHSQRVLLEMQPAACQIHPLDSGPNGGANNDLLAVLEGRDNTDKGSDDESLSFVDDSDFDVDNGEDEMPVDKIAAPDGVRIEGEGEYPIMDIIDNVTENGAVATRSSAGPRSSAKHAVALLTNDSQREVAFNQIRSISGQSRRKPDPVSTGNRVEVVSKSGRETSMNAKVDAAPIAAAGDEPAKAKKDNPTDRSPEEDDEMIASLPANEPVEEQQPQAAPGGRRTRIIKRRRIIWDPDAPETQFSYSTLVRRTNARNAISALNATKKLPGKRRGRPPTPRSADGATSTPAAKVARSKTPNIATATDYGLPEKRRRSKTLDPDRPSTSKAAAGALSRTGTASAPPGESLNKKRKISEIERLLKDEGAKNMIDSLESSMQTQERSRKRSRTYDKAPVLDVSCGAVGPVAEGNDAGPSHHGKIAVKAPAATHGRVKAQSSAAATSGKVKTVTSAATSGRGKSVAGTGRPKAVTAVAGKPKSQKSTTVTTTVSAANVGSGAKGGKRNANTTAGQRSSWDYVLSRQGLNEEEMIARCRSNSSYSSNTSARHQSFEATPQVADVIHCPSAAVEAANPPKNTSVTFAAPVFASTSTADSSAVDRSAVTSRVSVSDLEFNFAHPNGNKGQGDKVLLVCSLDEKERIAHIKLKPIKTLQGYVFCVQMLNQLSDTIDGLNKAKNCNVIVLTSLAPHFCQGVDLINVLSESSGRMDLAKELALAIKNFVWTVIHSKKPIIAGANGDIRGFGTTQLALYDVVVAANGTTFDVPQMKYGQMPEGHWMWAAMPKVGHTLRTKLFLLRERLNCRESIFSDIIHTIVSPKQVEDEVMRIARTMAQNNHASYLLMRSQSMTPVTTALGQLDDEFRLIIEQWTGKDFERAFKNYYGEF